MITVTIDGKTVSVPEGSTILAAACRAGRTIPTLCFLKDLSEPAACRVCVVEVKGAERLVAACNTAVTEGMEVLTDTLRVREARRRNLQLVLSAHDADCPNCPRDGNCRLQALAREMNLAGELPFAKRVAKDLDPADRAFVRKDSKCISCLRCVNVCAKMQGMNVWDLVGLGSTARVGRAAGKEMLTACTYCGQCVTHCPVGALVERDDTRRFLRALADPDTTVVVQVAPAVRAAWGEGFGLEPERATMGRLVTALRKLGADYVFDTDFAADLTIMEEGYELLARLKDPSFKAPMFTSCCPGWVRFLKIAYPDMVPQLSTAKSPQQMFGAVAKTYFARRAGIDPQKIFCVAVMPCTAKKWECDVAETNDAGAGQDVDLALTTREIERLVRSAGIDVASLAESECDAPLGTGTGAGVIFGATGGVMEAALRTAYAVTEGKNPDPDAFRAVRGDGRREVTVTLAGREVRACVTSGLANARRVVEDIRAGRAAYDFVEIMACPGGCAGGGGQPIFDGWERASERAAALYGLDAAGALRFSHENPDVQTLYREDLGEPLGHKAHALLHTDRTQWKL